MSAATAVIGSTGLTGSHILSLLVNSSQHPSSSQPSVVQSISRRAPPLSSPKLTAVVQPDTSVWSTQLAALVPLPTTVISALGTTRQAAGGIANQWKIDHDLNVDLVKAARTAGVRNFVFVSSAGTRSFPNNRLPYCKMKNGVEDAIRDADFQQAIILKPGLILGDREKPHQGGPLLIGLARGLGRWVGQWAQDTLGQEAEVIARAAVHAARIAEEGKAPSKYWVVEPAEIVRLGRDEWKE